ncbi:hypothetical protein QR680_013855 [Steinernema hermaphroditum]|uniref:TIL domain-containing protein n=1 Tax=Steinernema hermaphroditum TaxID=289476 RepID=A0AA39M380_9BILA|nr:hypothetical protein QR680_013855 [Steinernema hermaphroditum]
MKSFATIVVGSVAVFAVLTYGLECPKNEILTTDATHNLTCHNEIFDLLPINETLVEHTQPYCKCTNGLVRDDDGECVTRTECWKQLCADIVCPEKEYCTMVKVPVSADNSTQTIHYNVWAGCIRY